MRTDRTVPAFLLRSWLISCGHIGLHGRQTALCGVCCFCRLTDAAAINGRLHLHQMEEEVVVSSGTCRPAGFVLAHAGECRRRGI
jgi:hypothetical protein